MHFQERFAVLGLVTLGQHVRRQLALLAEQDERLVELVGDDRADQEATGIHCTDMGEIGFDIALGKAVGHQAQGAGRLKQRRDVTKDHTRLGEVDNGANQGFDVERIKSHRRGVQSGKRTRSIPAASPIGAAAAWIRPPANRQPMHTAGSGRGYALLYPRRQSTGSAGNG